MPGRNGQRLVSAWSPPEFASAVDTIADARGVSRSELLRAALVREALATPAATPGGTPAPHPGRRPRPPRPPEVRAKISAGKKGRPHSPEHRAAIAKSVRRAAEVPTTCPRCGRACRGEGGLANHLRYCEGTVAYVRCGECGWEMPPGGQLAQHQRATGHTGRESVS